MRLLLYVFLQWRLQNFLSGLPVNSLPHSMHLATYGNDELSIVHDTESMMSVMAKFDKTDAWRLPVLDSDGVYLGFISRSRILTAYREELKEISHD